MSPNQFKELPLLHSFSQQRAEKEEEKERMKKEKLEKKRKEKIEKMKQTQVEKRICELDRDIKNSLGISGKNVEAALQAFSELDKLPLTHSLLLKEQDIIHTVKKCTKFTGDGRIKKKAEYLLNKFKNMLIVPTAEAETATLLKTVDEVLQANAVELILRVQEELGLSDHFVVAPQMFPGVLLIMKEPRRHSEHKEHKKAEAAKDSLKPVAEEERSDKQEATGKTESTQPIDDKPATDSRGEVSTPP